MSETAAGPFVRRAREHELAAVGDVTAAAYASFVLGPDDPYVVSLRDARARFEEADLLVAVDARSRVLGTVTSCPAGSPWRELAGPDEGEFRMLAVDPAAQGRGAGVALVRASVARAAAAGATRVVLSSLAMMGAAHRLYEGLGFRRDPARDWSPVDGVDLLVFSLDLTDGP